MTTTHDPACASKRRHPDELSARAHAMFALEEYGNVRKLYVYRCPTCRGWHLTKSDNGRRLMVTADNPVHV
jgi:hypothetical protein